MEPVVVHVDRVLEHLKQSMLTQSPKIACHGCDKPYCCRNQVRIEIATTEFEQIKPYITDEQYMRAKKEIDSGGRMMNGQKVYTCPFNNPTTGVCEIYESRFIVCAGHGVVADNAEACNTETNKKGTFIVNPFNTITRAAKSDNATLAYLQHHSENGKPTDILECFKKLV